MGFGLALLVRNIQNLRKQAGLDIADRIVLCLGTESAELMAAIDSFGEYIREETLTVEIVTSPLDAEAAYADVKIGGQALRIGLKKTGTA